MVRWPAGRVVGEARYPSARGCAGGSIGTETVPAVGGLRDSAGAPWERGDVAGTSALPPPNHALERTGHSGHPWPAWGCPCGPPLTASVRLLQIQIRSVLTLLGRGPCAHFTWTFSGSILVFHGLSASSRWPSAGCLEVK